MEKEHVVLELGTYDYMNKRIEELEKQLEGQQEMYANEFEERSQMHAEEIASILDAITIDGSDSLQSLRIDLDQPHIATRVLSQIQEGYKLTKSMAYLYCVDKIKEEV